MTEARKWIRLRETLSGGRADGRPWPVAGQAIDVPDWEYDHCIAAGWAEHADPPAVPEPEKAKVPEPVAPAPEPVPEANKAGHPTGNLVQSAPEPVAPAPEPEKDPVPEPAEQEPPRPSDPKQDWVDYAVTRGLAGDKAAAMSKADLMSRYGGRL